MNWMNWNHFNCSSFASKPFLKSDTRLRRKFSIAPDFWVHYEEQSPHLRNMRFSYLYDETSEQGSAWPEIHPVCLSLSLQFDCWHATDNLSFDESWFEDADRKRKAPVQNVLILDSRHQIGAEVIQDQGDQRILHHLTCVDANRSWGYFTVIRKLFAIID